MFTNWAPHPVSLTKVSVRMTLLYIPVFFIVIAPSYGELLCPSASKPTQGTKIMIWINLTYLTLSALIASGWIPSWISELICSTGCAFSSMESSCSLLELSVLQPGEEKEALKFFYPTWAEADSMELPPETGEPSPPSELLSLLGGSVGSSLAVRHKGKMVGQMLGEKHTRKQVIGKLNLFYRLRHCLMGKGS